MSIQERIQELLAQRADIDAQLNALKDEAAQQLAVAQSHLQIIEVALGKPVIKHSIKEIRGSSPIDETDAGMGIGRDSDQEASAQDFRDELAELRERSQQRRARR